MALRYAQFLAKLICELQAENIGESFALSRPTGVRVLTK